MSAIVSVLVLTRLTDPRGGIWHPGERAGFEPDVAARLVERGVAKYAEPVASPQPRIVDGPPAHTMIAEPPAKKWRRGKDMHL